MSFTTLITCTELRALQAAQAPLVLLDASADLADPASAERTYAAGHVPGALHAHLERDLCGAKTGRNGRHPLPRREDFAATVGAWGITPGTQVVVFDGQGSPYAAHLWWMLRWLGHAAVAVLDGGIQAWCASGGALVTTPASVQPRPPYPLGAPAMPTVDAAQLLATLGRQRILDARAGERFRGEVETLDPVAGHIPGASHRFFKDNLDAAGFFKPAAELRAAFAAMGDAPQGVVHQCGSGVTACVNLLAMEHAGLHGSALYPGSWSEWCSDPARPIARG
jgi:thiosulfate/3-mercaptopyruvate sulfurtransferase